MTKSIEQLLVDLIEKRLKDSQNGLIVRVGDILEIDTLFNVWDTFCNSRQLHVSIIGKPTTFSSPNFIISNDIEKAVEWRSIPEFAGKIIVFLFTDSDKLHSLSEFDVITTRDLSMHLINEVMNQSQNIPLNNFWKAINNSIQNFSFKSIYDFISHIEFSEKVQDSILANMWRMNLLRDDQILDAKVDVDARLNRNQEMRLQISSLSGESQNRLSKTIHNYRLEKNKNELISAYKLVKDYSRFGNIDVLKSLDYETVELLLSASKPQRKKKKSEDQISVSNKKELRGKELQKVINESLLSDNIEDQKPLVELLDLLRKHQKDSTDEGDDDRKEVNHFDGRFNGNTVVIESYDKDIVKLVNRGCNQENWGGVIHAHGNILKDIILEDDNEFDPFKPSKPTRPLDFNGVSLFDFIRNIDNYLNIEEKFSTLIDDLISQRGVLANNIELLMQSPNLLFGVDKTIFETLKNYINTWDKLLRLYNDNESSIREKSQQSAHYIGRSLLSLDSLYIKTGTSNEWKVIILPLHPLYLWRYYEIFSLISRKDELSSEDRDIFASKLSEIPNLVNFVVVDKLITNEQDMPLPHSGNIGVLPTFENKTNRYLGSDGVEYISDILSRWISYAPYSTKEIRLALIDSPDLVITIKSIKNFLIEHNCEKIILNSFYTHNQNATGELIKIEYESTDSDIADLIKKNRLELRVFSKNLSEIEQHLIEKPVHISFFFDQSTYQIQYGKQTSFLHISPLVVSYDYEYDEITRQGSIFPSSDSNDTLLGRYFTLMKYAEFISSNSYPRPTFNKTIDLQSVNNTISNKGSLWLAVADRTIEHYDPQMSIPIGEKHVGRRNICIWAHEDSRIVSQYDQILRNYNIIPQDDYLKKVLKDFGHIAAEGLISIPKFGKEGAIDIRRKGLLGTIFASSWYTKINTTSTEKPLVVSLDSEDARVWLNNPESNERADLLGIRFDEKNNTLFFDVLEVKTRDDNPGRHAIDQVKRMMSLLREIFDSDNKNKDIFTLSRREILKFQIITECFRSNHDNEWKILWSKRLKDAFSDDKKPFNITIRAKVIHINFSITKGSEERTHKNESDVEDLDISEVVLGTKDIQQWIFENHAIVDTQWAEKTDFDYSTNKSINIDQQDFAIESDLSQISNEGLSNLETQVTVVSKVIEPLKNENEISQESRIENDFQIEKEKLARDFRKATDGFRVKIKSCDPNRAIIGHNVIRFFVELERGQSLDSLINKLDDIGREMSRTGLLIQSIKNSSEINLDVPLVKREIAYYSKVYDKIKPISSVEQMPIPIGITPEGGDIIKDLSTFPHLLIGGSTGSGKTVFLFTLILSLLKTHPKPSDLNLIIMSTGVEDFIRFMDLSHLVNKKVISDSREGIRIIEEVVHEEFKRRQELLVSERVPNITEYNQKSQVKLPPMVVIIDEFADLVDQLTNKKDKDKFYEIIRQIAQIGRKRGIHLVLCTQRPSADLVPTNIRALLNTQVALRVNDASSSRMILGEMGAENLLKHGDLIYKNGQENDKLRAQGYFVTTDEIDKYLEQFTL